MELKQKFTNSMSKRRSFKRVKITELWGKEGGAFAQNGCIIRYVVSQTQSKTKNNLHLITGTAATYITDSNHICNQASKGNSTER